jgi:hypothetical protein
MVRTQSQLDAADLQGVTGIILPVRMWRAIAR